MRIATCWPQTIACVLVVFPLNCLAGPSILDGKIAWKALGPVRDAEQPLPAIRIDGPPGSLGKNAPDARLFRSALTGGEVDFRLEGEASEKRSMRWQAGLAKPQPPAAQYFRLRYRATGIAREHTPYPVLELRGQDSQGKALAVPLLDCQAIVNDGRSHVLVGKLSTALRAGEAVVQMVTEDSLAWLRLQSLELYADRTSLPAAVGFDAPATAPAKGARFLPLPLADGAASPSFNDSVVAAFDRVLDKYRSVVDGGRGCRSGAVVVDGVPFQIAASEKNLLRPDERDAANNEKVEFLGAQIARRSFFPPSRDDAIAVALNGRRATEVYFLLVCEMPTVQTRYGLASAPFRLDDVEAFAVELQYQDGTCDWAHPYSLADEGCVLARMLGAYGVAADESRPLEKIVFHNRLFGVTVSLAAVTLNTAQRLVPALVDETPPVPLPRPATTATRRPYLGYRQGQLTGGNAHYQFVADCRRGFAFSRLANSGSPTINWKMDPSSGLEAVLARRQRTVEERNQLAGTAGHNVEVDIGKTVFTGRAFAVEQVQVARTTATINLRSLYAALPLEIVLRIAVDDSPRLSLGLAATNRGQTPLAATLRFPAIKGLVLGNPQDTWIFFPQYRTVITRNEGYFTAFHGPYFSHQFFDVFNPVAGLGLMTLTDNVQQFPLEYSMRKAAGGVDCGIAWPSRFHAIAPGQTFRPSQASLVFHAGDWRQALAQYQNWLQTWYRPRRVRGDWWRSAFVMRSHVISPDDSMQINHTPSIFDPATGRYRIDEAMEADRRYWDRAPDLVHFYGWYFRDREKNYAWGEYSTAEAYAQAGGLEALRRAIARFQDDLHLPVSLYTIGDRCSRGTAAFQRFAQAGSQWRDGAPLPLEETPMGSLYSMCWGYRPWQDHCIADLQKLRQDTAAKIIYLDVFPLQKGNACDCPTHSHETPLWFDRASRTVLSRAREALSQDVAIYSEYPMSDVTSQDIDGNVAYYNLPLHRHFDKLFDVAQPDERAALEAETPMSLYRYVFPQIKQFCFAVGTDHGRGDSCQKIPFFHGDAEYGFTWRLKPERIRRITNRGLAIQKAYPDCFLTDTPQPEVRTERRGVHANGFPGQGRMLWTLWNARYQTVRGPLLAVEHVSGARYFDAWNDRPLEPEMRGRQAVLSIEMEPQGLGCIVQIPP